MARKSNDKSRSPHFKRPVRVVSGGSSSRRVTYYKYVSKKKRFPLFLEIILIRGKHYDNLLTELALSLKKPYFIGVQAILVEFIID
ncbi:hypothetical protein UB32_10255 [Mesobacillus subterraneus]|uniref:Uncharacterized protein n=1 Tax=Mesobacillus subterraneus TaxID=285983 RepID=A0A0D6Z9T2_9BACI|nr:hypothetical protein UB32_10255 [Mesobacillus subterraneus]